MSPPQKRVKLDEIDPRFNFDALVKDWRSNVASQPVLSTEIQLLEGNGGNDESRVDFELPSAGTLLPGNSTRFYIEGTFEMKKEGEEIWTAIPATEADKVMLIPNWFDKIASVSISTGTQGVQCNDEPAFVAPYLNEMLNAHMDPELKKFLFIESCHPGHAAVIARSDWDFEGKAWKEYAATIFNGGKFNFSWIPINAWPLFQNGKFVLDTERPPRAVPLSIFDRTNRIRLEWKTENFKQIFIKKATEEVNTTEYRVSFSKPKLAIEVGIDNPKQPPFNKVNELVYVGPSRKVHVENVINPNTLNARMSGAVLPPGLLLFLLPSKLAAGEAKENIGFLKFPFKNIVIKFNRQMVFNSDETHTNGRLGLDRAQNLMNHLQYPICSIPVDTKTMTFDLLKDDGTKYAFPHIYIRLTPGYQQRNVPYNVDLKSFVQPGDLDIEITFKDADAPEDKSVLICCAMYEDVNATVHLKTKQILNRYNNMLL